MTAPGNLVVAFDLRGASPEERRIGPMARICGLPALVRTLLVLRRQGYAGAVLLAAPEALAAWRETLAGHHRLAGVPLQVAASPSELPGAVARVAPADQVLFWPGAMTFGRLAPALVSARAPDGGAMVGAQDGPIQLSLRALVDHPGQELPELLAKLAEAGALTEVALELEPLRLASTEDTRRAEAALLQSLRKSADGVVAKYDRHVSLFISRRLMPLPISPNWVTLGAVLLGLACGLAAAQGGYFWLLAGALGFQINSVMDGIDGEIARAKLLESRLGQWLDTLADDLSNLSFTVGAAVGCHYTWGGVHYLWLAGIIGVGFILTAILEYHYVITVARSGDLNDFRMPWEERDRGSEPAQAGPLARLLARLKFLVRRDTFVFLSTLFALAGQLRVMVWFFALGATIVWVSILTYRVVLPRLGRAPEARP